jgi:carboxyl-terminal processing protease
MLTQHKPTNIILIVSLVSLIFFAGYYVRDKSGAYPQTAKGKEVKFDAFWEAWNTVERESVFKEKFDSKKQLEGAIRGMVASVGDTYTFYLNDEELKKDKENLNGNFSGIGAELDQDKETSIISVARPIPGSPAEKAGILKGDFIYKVDNVLVGTLKLPEVINKIRGPDGTTVTLTIYRGREEKEITIKRGIINIPTIELKYTKDIAHLKLNLFGEKTDRDWDKNVEEIAAKYASGTIKGMVLDLRGNPGGLLNSAVHLAEEFLPLDSVIVKQEGNQNRVYKVARNGKLITIPLTVLINKGSASASEILGGALKDQKRATLVGQKSFGKGSVQEVLELPSGGGLHVTVAKWILPNGDWIHEKGITPDVEVKEETTPAASMVTPTPAVKEEIVDLQLNKAIEVLTGKK